MPLHLCWKVINAFTQRCQFLCHYFIPGILLLFSELVKIYTCTMKTPERWRTSRDLCYKVPSPQSPFAIMDRHTHTISTCSTSKLTVLGVFRPVQDVMTSYDVITTPYDVTWRNMTSHDVIFHVLVFLGWSLSMHYWWKTFCSRHALGSPLWVFRKAVKHRHTDTFINNIYGWYSFTAKLEYESGYTPVESIMISCFPSVSGSLSLHYNYMKKIEFF